MDAPLLCSYEHGSVMWIMSKFYISYDIISSNTRDVHIQLTTLRVVVHVYGCSTLLVMYYFYFIR